MVPVAKRRNYRRELEQLIAGLGDTVPTLMMHSCCAPCSSYCLEYLSQYFSITLVYYNPNIFPEEEYVKRAEELKRLVSQLPVKHPVSVIVEDYHPEEFYNAVKGMENLPEGKERCAVCYRLRLERAAKLAAERGFDYFCSTLSVGPRKNCSLLNEIGETLSQIYSVKHLPNDFKKRNGYQRSIELSHEYGLYRQDYCGCVFSKTERQPK